MTAAEAIVQGLSEDGGLLVPESIPQLSGDMIAQLCEKPYSGKAAYIMGSYLEDFSAEELRVFSEEAYNGGSFDDVDIAPLYKLDDATYFLELWHGPTCAFKDMALQVMPRLLTASLRKTGDERNVCVLVATSGDTGKAALEGFRDVPGTKIMVFYPRDGVSEIQKLQMTTQSGGNVSVIAVEGNFDDAQTGVKGLFSDEGLRDELARFGCFLSSANSINWGRLVPQIAYYFSAYCGLLGSGAIEPGGRVNFCVPTGNFGNILAAYYASEMGLPVNKLICASNSNDVLTQFISTGVYDRNRPFYTTSSPSMDILVSSNLERLLFHLSGKDGDAIKTFMSALSSGGRYEVPSRMRDEAVRLFSGGRCSEADTFRTIAETFYNHDYLLDTHTAVASKVLSDYREQTGDMTPSVVVSTASPFKFCRSVLEALGRRRSGAGAGLKGESLTAALSEVTGKKIPAPISAIEDKKQRFTEIVPVSGMRTAIIKFLE